MSDLTSSFEKLSSEAFGIHNLKLKYFTMKVVILYIIRAVPVERGSSFREFANSFRVLQKLCVCESTGYYTECITQLARFEKMGF